MRFQVVDWEVEDLPEEDIPEHLVPERARPPSKRRSRAGSDDDEEDESTRRLYVVTAYGRLADGRSIAVRLSMFQPFFYVRIHGLSSLKGTDAKNRFLEHLLKHSYGEARDEIRAVYLRKKTDFFGFSASEKRDCISVTFDSLRAMRQVASKLRAGNGMMIRLLDGIERRVVVHESRIEPLTRLLHSRDIPSAGWVEIDDADLVAGEWARTDLCYTTSYKSVKPVQVDSLAPVVMASFDIECTVESDTVGDFPVAIKTYRKIANNIRDTVEAGIRYKATASQRKDLIRLAVLLTMGLEPPDALLETKRWMDETSPVTLGRRVLGSVRLKRPASAGDINTRLTGIVEDLHAYAVGDVNYVNKSMPSTPVEQIQTTLDGVLPPLKGDPVIQIGVTANRIGESACFSRWICVLGGCAPVEGAVVKPCGTEEEVLMAFADHLREIDPDMITGYNIFGFDMKYIHDRATEVGILGKFLERLSRLRHSPARFVEKRLSSSALGDNVFWIVQIPGVVPVDLMKVVMRDHKLESYKLDNVAKHFTGEEKRDVSPQDIFRLHGGSDQDRAVVADYCVQDCALCNSLLEKLKVVINAVAMATISHVPVSYIFLRGQGVKILSLVSYHCRKRDMIIRDLPKPLGELDDDAPDWKVRRFNEERRAIEMEGPQEDVEVQGAIVLEPDTGFYVDDPVAVCDYASLYPSSIMSHGISPDARVVDDRYRGLPGYTYLDVSYDLYEGKGDDKHVVGQETLTFAKRDDEDLSDPDTLSIIPAIERTLLTARKTTRKRIGHKRVWLADGRELVGELRDVGGGRMAVGGVEFAREDVDGEIEDAYSDFMKAVLDSQQLSYKLLANSVYGQLGARTSDIRDVKLAACVTAVGRGLIMQAKDFIHKHGGTVVYGDTDSVFCTFPVYDPATGERLKGAAALPLVIEKTMRVGKAFTKQILPAPHDLEYEKTFWPLMLLAKKKYVGNMYEDDPTKFKLKYMGIVLKRRDNAPIVRRVMSTLLDRLLNDLNVNAALCDMLNVIDDVVDAAVPMEELIITKTLRGEYKDRSKIAHAVLAQRIGERDPGNAPQVNDRIPMVYVRTEAVNARRGNARILQGDRVEDPDYVTKNGLEPDMEYYLENQIMRPLMQMLGALAENLPGYNKPPGYFERMADDLTYRYRADPSKRLTEETIRKKVRVALDKARQEVAKSLVFQPKLARLRNKYNRQADLFSMGFFAGRHV
nr:DNA polymerase family B [Oceanusvirus sp.]